MRRDIRVLSWGLASVHYYRVFGLHVRSEVEFPELVESSAGEWASDLSRQVEVELGPTPDQLSGPKAMFGWIEAAKSETLFKVEECGKIYVDHGVRIRVELDAPDKLIKLRPYMITCGFATLAFHRGWIPLHVGAVRSPKGVILFCGPSGAGKSTTTTAVAKLNNWDLLADDMVILEPTSPPMMHLGVKRVKLWLSAAEALGVDVAGLQQDYFRPFKYHIPIDAFGSFPSEEVIGLVKLEWGPSTKFIKLSQGRGLEELVNSIYPDYFARIYLESRLGMSAMMGLFPLKECCLIVRDNSSDTRSSLAVIANNLLERLMD